MILLVGMFFLTKPCLTVILNIGLLRKSKLILLYINISNQDSNNVIFTKATSFN